MITHSDLATRSAEGDWEFKGISWFERNIGGFCIAFSLLIFNVVLESSVPSLPVAPTVSKFALQWSSMDFVKSVWFIFKKRIGTPMRIRTYEWSLDAVAILLNHRKEFLDLFTWFLSIDG